MSDIARSVGSRSRGSQSGYFSENPYDAKIAIDADGLLNLDYSGCYRPSRDQDRRSESISLPLNAASRSPRIGAWDNDVSGAIFDLAVGLKRLKVDLGM